MSEEKKELTGCPSIDNGNTLMEQQPFISKYHRKQPIRDFDVSQTLYDLVIKVNAGNMDYNYASYFGKKRTFAQLKEETDALASAFYSDGVRLGDTVGICLLTVPEVAPVLLALNKLGAVSFWIDIRTNPADVAHYINDLGIEELVIIEPLLPVIMQALNCTKLRRVVVVSPMNFLGTPPDLTAAMGDKRMVAYADYLEAKNASSIKVATYARDRWSLIVQSSGSTGKSKAIVHTDFNLNSQIKKMSYGDMPFFLGRHSFVCAPPWVIYGLVNSIYSGLVFGLELIYTLEPKEEMVYQHIDQLDIVFGVPVYYRYLYNVMLRLSEAKDDESKSELMRIKKCLRHASVFISGGDKILEEDVISWQHMFDLPVANGYGNNEVVGAALISPRFANRPGSIGVPLYHTIVKTYDNASERILPDGEEGEVIISSEALFVEYLNAPEETAKIKQLHDGKWWVHTGDLGHVDADGFVYLNGRTKRLIIDKLGYKISAENSENFISRLPYVNDCVVIGAERGPNDRVPMAFIELNCEYIGDDSILSVIEQACRDHLKDYECPVYYKKIDTIPHKQDGGKRNFLLLESLGQQYVDGLRAQNL